MFIEVNPSTGFNVCKGGADVLMKADYGGKDEQAPVSNVSTAQMRPTNKYHVTFLTTEHLYKTSACESASDQKLSLRKLTLGEQLKNMRFTVSRLQ